MYAPPGPAARHARAAASLPVTASPVPSGWPARGRSSAVAALALLLALATLPLSMRALADASPAAAEGGLMPARPALVETGPHRRANNPPQPEPPLRRLSPALHPALTGSAPLPDAVLVWFEEPPSPQRSARHSPADHHPAHTPREARQHGIAAARAQLRERLRLRGDLPRFRRAFRHFPALLVAIRDREELQRLAEDPGVRRIEPELRLVPHAMQSLALVGQPIASARGLTGAGTSVVVLDTGVNFTHPDFGCSAPGAPSGCRVRHAEDIAPNDGRLDSSGHGSNIAGIVAALAPATGIVALDVFDGATAAVSDVLAGIDWAIQQRDIHRIVAINISIGVPGSRHAGDCPSVIQGYTPGGVPLYGFFNPFESAIAAATAAGINVVTSAGNEGWLDGLPLPACTPQAISVGAVYDAPQGARGWTICSDPVTAADQVTCFSNASADLDLLAPGALITAGGSTWGGTSQAAPHVAAAVALVRQAFPGESPDLVRGRLVTSGRSITDARGIPIRVFPRLDFTNAFPLPANDNFNEAMPLTGDAPIATGSNTFATREPGEPLHAALAGGGSLWFSWTPASSRAFRLRTTGSTLDTLLAVYTGANVGELVPLASDDDGAGGGQSQVLLSASAGQLYRIAVDGKAGARGNVVLDIVPVDSADLALTLTLPSTRVAIGVPLPVRLGVRNAGPAAAVDTRLALTLPMGITISPPWPPGCSSAGAEMQCNLGDIPAGGERVIEATLLPLSVGEYSLDARVTSELTADPRSANDASSSALVAQA